MNDSQYKFLSDLRQTAAFYNALGVETLPLGPEVKAFMALARGSERPAGRQPSRPPLMPRAAGRKSQAPPSQEPGAGGIVGSLTDIQGQFGECGRCPLHEGRKRIFFGQGNPRAGLFIVSQWPTAVDEAQGALFSGAEEALLSRMLAAIKLSPAEVYFSSVVKCPASEERPPTASDIKHCLPFLLAQIKAVAPKVVCTLGPLAAQALLRSRQPLVRLRGRWRRLPELTSPAGDALPLMATFHPAYLLRNEEMKKAAWHDLLMIQQRLG
ncbi:MAG TPA: uracil-DNA glycosylase [Desulfobacterales bacterium]|nr:uracil-DNA glycosylase [Desulfobacterales bacterium]